MAKAKSAFTAKWVDAVAATAKRQEIPDPSLKGFYLVVQPLPGGAKSWAVRYKGNPKYTIGSVGAWALKDARKEAGRVMRAYDEGRDPRAEKQEANSDENLVENVLDEFVKRHVKKKNRTSTAGDVEGYIRREIKPQWKGKNIRAIRRRDIVDLLDSVVDRGAPTAANRLHSTLRKFFNWCLERGILETSPLGNIKAPSPENNRDRVLLDIELRWLWRATDEIGWPFGPLVRLLLLTGQRREEVAAASWSEFDLSDNEPMMWIIPAERAKNGKEQALALPPSALAMLNGLPRIEGKANLVFTTTGETAISGFSRAKSRLDEIMLRIAREEAEERGDDPDEVTILPWVVHDLRRTFASGAARHGISPHVVEAVLNHKSGTIRGVAAVYNRHDYFEEKRDALIRWERHILTIIAAEPGSNVVAFHGRGNKK